MSIVFFESSFRRRSFFRAFLHVFVDGFSSVVFVFVDRSFVRSSIFVYLHDLKIKFLLVTVKLSLYVPFLNASVLALPELHHGEVRTLRSSGQPPQSNGHPFQKVSGEF